VNVVFRGIRLGLGVRIYSLYSIKILMSMESPHKTLKPNVWVCICFSIPVGLHSECTQTHGDSCHCENLN